MYTLTGKFRAIVAVALAVACAGCERMFSLHVDNLTSYPVIVFQDDVRVGSVGANRSADFPRAASDVTLSFKVKSAAGGDLGTLQINEPMKRKALARGRRFDLRWDGKSLTGS